MTQVYTVWRENDTYDNGSTLDSVWDSQAGAEAQTNTINRNGGYAWVGGTLELGTGIPETEAEMVTRLERELMAVTLERDNLKAQVEASSGLAAARLSGPFDAGGKIPTIKVLRERFNIGLKDAKEIVDAWERDGKVDFRPVRDLIIQPGEQRTFSPGDRASFDGKTYRLNMGTCWGASSKVEAEDHLSACAWVPV